MKEVRSTPGQSAYLSALRSMTAVVVEEVGVAEVVTTACLAPPSGAMPSMQMRLLPGPSIKDGRPSD